jgi:hypothetical protein
MLSSRPESGKTAHSSGENPNAIKASALISSLTALPPSRPPAETEPTRLTVVISQNAGSRNSGNAIAERKGSKNMSFGYAQPFTFKLGGTPATVSAVRQPVEVTAVRQGVTEITLSDGRLVRASLQIKDVRPNRQKPGSLDISYNVVTEIVRCPDVPAHAAHETLQ